MILEHRAECAIECKLCGVGHPSGSLWLQVETPDANHLFTQLRIIPAHKVDRQSQVHLLEQLRTMTSLSHVP